MNIIELLGIKTYESEYKKLQGDNRKLESDIEILHKIIEQKDNANTIIAKDVINLEKKIDEMQKEIDLIKTDPEQYIERETEKRMIEFEKQHQDDMEHKWYQIGKREVFKNFGVELLEAKQQGKTMALIDDKPVEIFTDLETIYDEDEIIIDDLEAI